MITIQVLGHSKCAFCKQAIELLAVNGRSFLYLDAHQPENAALLDQIRAEGVRTVPQIWIEDTRIGGFDELKRYLEYTDE
jgi:glutaredoxin